MKKNIREIMTWRGSRRLALRRKAILAAAALTAVSVPFVIGIVRAQTLPPDPAYTYEVASIHKSAPGETNHLVGPGPQGGWRAQNMSPLALIQIAYSVKSYQITGAPAWASSDSFDITFTPEKKETPTSADPGLKEIESSMSRNAQRMRAVLRDRFGLVLRMENHELPIYNLLQAKGGHMLSPADPAGRPSVGESERQITGTRANPELLAQMLSDLLGRPVHDGTGLTGEYDFTLEWTPDAPPSDGFTTAPTGTDIFTALIDQLGLKLESTKGPVQVYVIEKIEHPTEN